VIAVAAWIGFTIVERLRIVVVPLVFAAFFTALLSPAVRRLERAGLGSGPSAALVLLCVAAVAGVVVTIAGIRFAGQIDQVQATVANGWDDVVTWLTTTFPITDRQIEAALREVSASVRNEGVASSVLSGAEMVLRVMFMIVLGVAFLFLLLKDGARIGAWAVALVPRERKARTAAVGARVWDRVSRFARAQVLIAAIESLLTAIALALLGVPLVLSLGILTFLAGFVPLLGPVVVGTIAVLVALSSEGLTTAALTLGAFVLVQQLEAYVLQPVVFGRSLDLHPLAVLLAVTIGGLVGGVLGAFVAVPLLAGTLAAIEEMQRTEGGQRRDHDAVGVRTVGAAGEP